MTGGTEKALLDEDGMATRPSAVGALRRDLGGRSSRFTLMAFDQALLSALMFSLNLALIHWGTKADYAGFAIVMSAALLSQSIQNAAICVPLMVLGRRWEPREFPGFEAHLRRVNLAGALISAVVCGAVALLAPGGDSRPAEGLAAATGLAVLGVWFREYRRTSQLREGRLGALAASDAIVAALVVSGLWYLVKRQGGLSALEVLAVLGAANLLVSMRGTLPVARSAAVSQHVLRDWSTQIRMSTTGSAVTWLQATSYPILVAAVVGTRAAADVAAARLFLSPGLLLGTAWGRLGMLRATEAIRDGGWARWRRFVTEQTVRVGFVTVAYIVVVVVAVAFGVGRILGDEYGNKSLIWCWLLVGFFTMIRTVASIALQGAAAFGELLRWGGVSALVSCAAVLALARLWGATGCVVGVAAGELVNCMAFFYVVRRLNKDTSSGRK